VLRHLPIPLTVTLSAAVLSACAGGTASSGAGQVSGVMPAALQTSKVASRPASSSNLYVAERNPQGTGSGYVDVYAPGGTSPIRTITDGIKQPFALALDNAGDLFVASWCGCDAGTGGVVTEYASGKGKVILRISVQKPNALAFDPSGNLFVGGLKTVTGYAPGSKTPFETISNGIKTPMALAFDSTGNLYVGNLGKSSKGFNNVTVYAPGNTTPSETITQGINYPYSLLIDQSNNLYVANLQGKVTIYAPGSTSPTKTVMKFICGPRELAFDSKYDLYVANWCSESDSWSVTGYAPGGGALKRNINMGIYLPTAIAFDNKDNLYVANNRQSGAAILVYPPNSTTPQYSITDGVKEVTAFGFGP
jgi:sugar lactone lactonase YvrE